MLKNSTQCLRRSARLRSARLRSRYNYYESDNSESRSRSRSRSRHRHKTKGQTVYNLGRKLSLTDNEYKADEELTHIDDDEELNVDIAQLSLTPQLSPNKELQDITDDIIHTQKLTDDANEEFTYIDCICGNEYDNECHNGMQLVECGYCTVFMYRECHFGSFRVTNPTLKVKCRNCSQKALLISGTNNYSETTSIDPTNPNYNRVEHNLALIQDSNELISQQMHNDNPPPDIESTNTLSNGAIFYRFVFDFDKPLVFKMKYTTFESLFNVDDIIDIWDNNVPIPRSGADMQGKHIFVNTETIVADIMDDILEQDPESDIFPSQPRLADCGPKGIIKGRKGTVGRIFVGGYCRDPQCGPLIIDSSGEKSVKRSRNKLFTIEFKKEIVRAAYKAKESPETIEYCVYSEDGAECNHERGSKYYYICNNVDKANIISPSDKVSSRLNTLTNKLNDKQLRSGNMRNVPSNQQASNIKTDNKQKSLGRVPGVNKLHQILNMKKQQVFKDNCEFFGLGDEIDKDAYDDKEHAMQGLYIEPHPFSVIYIDVQLLSLLRYRGMIGMLYWDYTMKLIKAWGANRFGGLIPLELDLYKGLNKIWVLEFSGDPPQRDRIGGGGTCSYGFMITENGRFENLSLFLHHMNVKWRRIYKIGFKKSYNGVKTDCDGALITPLLDSWGYDSYAEFNAFRWGEECKFLLADEKKIPFWSNGYNHFMKNIMIRADRNIEAGTASRKRYVLKSGSFVFWRNMMNRGYITQKYAIVEQIVLCHQREVLLFEDELPLRDMETLIQPSDIAGRSSYYSHNIDAQFEDIKESTLQSQGKLSAEEIEDLEQEVIKNKGIEIVQQKCPTCHNYNECILTDDCDTIIKFECDVCSYSLVLKPSNSHDIYQWIFGAKIPTDTNCNSNNNNVELKSYPLSKITSKRKLFTHTTSNKTYQTVTVYSDIDLLPLATSFVEVDKNKLPTTFKNPFKSIKLHKSFCKFANNKMIVTMKINQPRKFGRDGQATCENHIKQVKENFGNKTNETIPEFTQRRINLNEQKRKTLFANSYNNKTVPQRIRTKIHDNDNDKEENDIDEMKSSKWYRGKNVSESDFVSNFKCVTDKICTKFKVGKTSVVKSLQQWDNEFIFVTNSWFNSQYYDNAKYSVKTGQVYQAMKQILQLKSLPTVKKNKKKSTRK